MQGFGFTEVPAGLLEKVIREKVLSAKPRVRLTSGLEVAALRYKPL